MGSSPEYSVYTEGVDLTARNEPYDALGDFANDGDIDNNSFLGSLSFTYSGDSVSQGQLIEIYRNDDDQGQGEYLGSYEQDGVEYPNIYSINLVLPYTQFHFFVLGTAIDPRQYYTLIARDPFPAGAACYCPGTLIQTDRGEVPVEALAIGNVVITAAGQHRPIRWIGRRSYGGRFLAATPGVQPIRFRAGSFGDGLPRRDLMISPEHAMLLDGFLIPARCLVNGTTIEQERTLGRVDYYHVELDTHDVLLAEGAPSESFLDDDSRGAFHNAAEFAALYPDAPRPDGFCAPRIEQGAQLEAIRRRLAGLAEENARAA